MNKIAKLCCIVACGALFAQCDDYLETSSPSNTDDSFVTSSESETLKILSKAYSLYRQSAMGAYDWNDHFRTDMEYFPEYNSSNNINAKLVPENIPCDHMKDGFNTLYSVISYSKKVMDLVSAKAEYQQDVAAGKTTDWTQLMGEATTLRAFSYMMLTLHFGDVPYGYEGSYVNNYTLSSRYDIYDHLLADLKAVEPYMYSVGEGGVTAERMTRTFTCALIGKIALASAGYQTIRTDVDGLYGNVQFETLATDSKRKCAYARRSDYTSYYSTAEEYLNKALTTCAGTTKLLTTDDRSYANNPFQRHFQYCMDLEVSPESIFEFGCVQNQAGNRFYCYDVGRGCNGGNNTAPNKVFAAVRINPTYYYGSFDNDDKRRDVSAVVTGLDGKGNETLFSFAAGAKTSGGICLNKWDICRQTPYFVGNAQSAGFNLVMMRVGEVKLLLAEAKANLGKSSEALSLLNDIRQRAYGDTAHNLSGLTGDDLKEAVLNEQYHEMFGEGWLSYDLARSGKFVEKAMATRTEMKKVAEDIQANGFHTFANGNVFPAYVWVKQVEGATLTYDCTDTTDPVKFPGWRGVLDFTGMNVKVTGTAHNTAIKGLFEYIDPDGSEAAALESEGYTRKDWGKQFASLIDTYLSNVLTGISSSSDVPCYYWPIPYETLTQSNGAVTNGYGFPQQ